MEKEHKEFLRSLYNHINNAIYFMKQVEKKSKEGLDMGVKMPWILDNPWGDAINAATYDLEILEECIKERLKDE